jgi:hypothetical protein
LNSDLRRDRIPFEVVVAHFNSLDFEMLFPLMPEAKFTVYDKSGKYRGDCIRIENVGREGESYLNHILRNYESLALKTLFIQDDVLSHRPQILSFVAEVLCDKSEFHQFPCSWGGGEEVYRRLVREGVCDLHTLGRPDIIKIACDELYIDLPHEYWTETCAFFSVTDESIRARGRSFYEGLRSWLIRSNTHEYALEHMWKLVF